MSRTSLIKIIHVASRRLQLDDETYRAILVRATGKNSCRQMNIAELEKVIRVMEDGGFKRTPARSAARQKTTSGESKKIRAIWNTMFHDHFITDGSDVALDAWVRHMTAPRNGGAGIASLAWVRDDHIVVLLECIKQWHTRLMLKWLNDNGHGHSVTGVRSYDRVRETFVCARRGVSRG